MSKLTVGQLRQIIREEVGKVNEAGLTAFSAVQPPTREQQLETEIDNLYSLLATIERAEELAANAGVEFTSDAFDKVNDRLVVAEEELAELRAANGK